MTLPSPDQAISGRQSPVVLPPLAHLDEPLVYTIDNTCRKAQLSRSKIYELIRAGALQTVKIGTRRLVLAKSIRELLQA